MATNGRNGKAAVSRNGDAPGASRDSVLSQLERDIIEGRLEPGERLDEQDLAARFGVSRTPIREVLLQLSSMGLVTLRPRRSALVRRMTGRQFTAMWEVVTALEGLCARLAARRMTSEDRRALKRVCEKLRTAADTMNLEAYDRANSEFHEAVYAGTHNAYLAERCREIRGVCAHMYRQYAQKQPGRLQRSFSEHVAIADAIVLGDEKRSDDLMQGYLMSGGQVYADLLALVPDVAAEDGG